MNRMALGASLLAVLGLLQLGCSSDSKPVAVVEEEKVERYVDPVRVINTTSPDPYENDDSVSSAKLMTPGGVQDRNFFDDATDWIKFSAKEGERYLFETTVFGFCDTILEIYDGETRLASHDDKSKQNYGSLLEFVAPTSKIYTVKIFSYKDRVGAKRAYTLQMKGPDIAIDPQPQPEISQKAWTFMVYMAGDNNLSPYTQKDVTEMLGVGNLENANVVLLWDDAGAKNGYFHLENGAASLKRDVGEVNTGAPQTAMNFIDFVGTQYPADRYGFVFWNHGGAVDRGVAWDDGSEGDHLTEVEQLEILKYGVERLGQPFELIGYDACLMATGEIFYQLKDVAKYCVASQQLEPGNGWDYAFLSCLKGNPQASGAQLASAIVDSFSLTYKTYSDVTLSVADLSKAKAFGLALDAFVQAGMSASVENGKFGTHSQGLPIFGGTYTQDLVVYLRQIQQDESMPVDVQTKAKALDDLICQQLILKNWVGSKWAGQAFGCAITLKPDTSIYSQLELCRDTQWNEFCNFAGFKE